MATTTTIAVAGQDVSFFDMCPVVSQIKSAIQLVTGDASAAGKTQINYLNEGIGPAQLRSAYFLATGEPRRALDVQEKFLANLEGLVDGTPLIGHLKGAVHLLNGQRDHGWHAISSATSSTGTVLGAALFGPLGAVGGHVATDLAITVADYALNGNKSLPYGLFEYASHANRKNAGEHFDAIASIALDVLGGKHARISRPAGAEGARHLWRKLKYRTVKTDRAANVDSWEMVAVGSDREMAAGETTADDELKFYGAATSLERLHNRKVNVFLDCLQMEPAYASLGLTDVFPGELIKRKFDGLDGYEYDANLEKLDVRALTDKMDYLSDVEKSLIDVYDFRTVNTEALNKNCFPCTVAGIMNRNADSLLKDVEGNAMAYHPVTGSDPVSFLDRYRTLGYVDYRHSGVLLDLDELNEYLKANAKDLQLKHLILIEYHLPPKEYTGHAVVLKFKMLENKPDPEILLIDYHFPGLLSHYLPNPYRFTNFVDLNHYSSFSVYAVKLLDKKP